jgi:hypothetical protein
MGIKIETYRGFDIEFTPDKERFSFKLDGGKWHEKQSFSQCKKLIDEFWKEKRLFEATNPRPKIGENFTCPICNKTKIRNFQNEI